MRGPSCEYPPFSLKEKAYRDDVNKYRGEKVSFTFDRCIIRDAN